MKTESFEGLTAKAILGDEREKDIAESRIVCKLAAQHRITCACGDILDQRRTVVFENPKGDSHGTFCHKCADDNAKLWPEDFTARTWSGSMTARDYVSPILERERKRAAKEASKKPATPRAKSFQQVITKAGQIRLRDCQEPAGLRSVWHFD